MADFNFYLNKQGAQGRKGEKGDDGFSPTISVSEQTLESYKLKIVNEYNEFETPNLLGNLNITDNGGTYLRYDKDTEAISAGEIDGATTEVVGGVRKSTSEDLASLSSDTVVTPANVADMMPIILEAGSDNVTIEQDEETSKTKITVTSESTDLTQLKAEVATNTADIGALQERTSVVEEDVTGLQTNKQNKLVAGTGINIDQDTNTISATGSGTGDVTAAGNNTFTGTNTFKDDVSILGGTLSIEGQLTSDNATIENLQAVKLTSSGRITAVEISATGIHDDNNKKYLNETDLDNQTISMVDGKVHVNMDELGNEVNDLSGRVTAAEADITTLQTDVTDINGDLDKKQTKLTAGANVTLTDLTDGTVRIDATGGGSTGDIPIASSTTLGGIKVGDNLSITDDGVLSATAGGDTSELLTGHGTTKFTNVSVNAQDKYASNEWYNHNNSLVAGIYAGANGLGIKDLHTNSLNVGLNGHLLTQSSGITLTPASSSSGTNTIKLGSQGNQKAFIASGGGWGLMFNPRITSYGSVPALTTDTDSSDKYPLYSTYNVKAGNGININVTDGDTITISSTATAPSIATTSSTGVVKPDGTTITVTEDGTISAVGGGSSAPENMVTTDTAQTITANKIFNSEIRVGDENGYSTLAKFSREQMTDGDSTFLEHVELGEATFVVKGDLGKRVYENDAYAYKRYINVDDLSDSRIAQSNAISSQVAHMAMPSDKYVDLTLGASGTTYTAPADGWFIFRAVATSAANTYIDTNIQTNRQLTSTTTYIVSFTGDTCGFVQQVQKGAVLTFVYDATFASNRAFRFVYAVGSEPTA